MHVQCFKNTTIFAWIKYCSVGTKKCSKKEHRKLDSHLAVALGPALFSTPDIIRRVGTSVGETAKATEVITLPISSPLSINNSSINDTPLITPSSVSTMISTAVVSNFPSVPASAVSLAIHGNMVIERLLDQSIQTPCTLSAHQHVEENNLIPTPIVTTSDSIVQTNLNNVNADVGLLMAEELQPSLESGMWYNVIV